jgi:thioredoxin
MLSTIITVLIGAGFGALMGYFGQCSSGTCPLTSTWWRGAIYGATIGLLASLLSGGMSGCAKQDDTNSAVVPITKQEEFDNLVLKNNMPVIVDFYADWCPPCRRLAPILKDYANQYTGKVAVVKVNVDKMPDIAKKYGINAIPTLIGFKNGNIQFQQTGVPPSDELKKYFDSLLK